MSTIIAGNFETFDAAQAAKADIVSAGLSERDVSVFFITPAGQHHKLPLGGDQVSDAGARHAGKGAMKGSLAGAAALGVLGPFAAWGYTAAMNDHGALVWIFAGVIGALAGAYVGSLAGAMSHTKGRPKSSLPDAAPGSSRDEPQRPSAVMLAANVDSQPVERFKAILAQHGAQRMEKATGRWESGHWADFDSTRPFNPL